MTRDELIRPWSDDEIRKLPVARNPFESVTDTAQGLVNAKRYAAIHYGTGGTDIKHPKDRTALENIETKLMRRRAGWHVQEHPITGAAAIFPIVPNYRQGSAEQRKLEDDWEKKSIEMHKNQKHLVLDDTAPHGYRFASASETEAVPKFHEVITRQNRIREVQLQKEAEERATAAKSEPKDTIKRFEDSPEAKSRLHRGD